MRPVSDAEPLQNTIRALRCAAPSPFWSRPSGPAPLRGDEGLQLSDASYVRMANGYG
jgi:hypothetical protein